MEATTDPTVIPPLHLPSSTLPPCPETLHCHLQFYSPLANSLWVPLAPINSGILVPPMGRPIGLGSQSTMGLLRSALVILLAQVQEEKVGGEVAEKGYRNLCMSSLLDPLPPVVSPPHYTPPCSVLPPTLPVLPSIIPITLTDLPALVSKPTTHMGRFWPFCQCSGNTPRNNFMMLFQ